MQIKELMLQAEKNRKRLVEVVQIAKAGHIGGGLSSMNMLTALYFHVMNIDPKNPKWEERDRFVMSKGHCVEALYSVLENRGFISKELTDTYGQFDTPLAGHPTIEVPGIEVNSGALGHGLPIGVGMAIAAKLYNKSWKTFVLLGVGELGDGSFFVAALAGSHYKLDNLVAIIDRNGLQISDTTENVMALESFSERWGAFGWDVVEINGDKMEEIVAAFESIDYTNGKPHLIVSRTTKGCGVKLMENILKWHHGVPTQAEYEEAIAEIEARIESLTK
ncbi:MAG: transketolase [Alistipes sp.]|nr:transketolase [Alistipes sp.]